MADRSSASMLGTVLVALATTRGYFQGLRDDAGVKAIERAAADLFDTPEVHQRDFSFDQMGESAEDAAVDLGIAVEMPWSVIEPTPEGQKSWYDEGEMTLVYRGTAEWREHVSPSTSTGATEKQPPTP